MLAGQAQTVCHVLLWWIRRTMLRSNSGITGETATWGAWPTRPVTATGDVLVKAAPAMKAGAGTHARSASRAFLGTTAARSVMAPRRVTAKATAPMTASACVILTSRAMIVCSAASVCLGVDARPRAIQAPAWKDEDDVPMTGHASAGIGSMGHPVRPVSQATTVSTVNSNVTQRRVRGMGVAGTMDPVNVMPDSSERHVTRARHSPEDRSARAHVTSGLRAPPTADAWATRPATAMTDGADRAATSAPPRPFLTNANCRARLPRLVRGKDTASETAHVVVLLRLRVSTVTLACPGTSGTFATSRARPTAAARTEGVGLTATVSATKAGRVTPVSAVRRVDMETIAACRAIG